MLGNLRRIASAEAEDVGSARHVVQPGESISRQLWLTTPRKWFESQRAEWYWYYHQNVGSLPGFTRAWALLTFGAELTFQVTSNCAKTSEQGPYVLPKDSIYSAD